MSQEEDPTIRLKKLAIGLYTYTLSIKGQNEDSRIDFEVIGFPTSGVYHLRFTEARGMDRANISHLLNFEKVIFETNSISKIAETTTITVKDFESGISYKLENILFVLRQEIDNSVTTTQEDLMNNKYYRNAMKSVLNSQKTINSSPPPKSSNGFFNWLNSLNKK